MASIPGFSNDYGQLRQFEWDDVVWPSTSEWNSSGPKYYTTSSTPSGILDLSLAAESAPNESYPVGNELMHYVDPLNPTYPSWGYKYPTAGHHRSEVYNKPWSVDHPSGTEEWFGWSVRFPATYIPKDDIFINIAQIKNSTVGESPAVKLMLAHGNDPNLPAYNPGELMLANNANDTGGDVYHPTGVAPAAGETWQFVFYIKHDKTPDGIIRWWGSSGNVTQTAGDLLFEQTSCDTVYGAGTGGNVKLGAYIPLWKYQVNIEKDSVPFRCYQGTTRLIANRSSDPNYGTDYFDTVKPNQTDVTPPEPVEPSNLEIWRDIIK
jgi:hypothetical protein